MKLPSTLSPGGYLLYCSFMNSYEGYDSVYKKFKVLDEPYVQNSPYTCRDVIKFLQNLEEDPTYDVEDDIESPFANNDSFLSIWGSWFPDEIHYIDVQPIIGESLNIDDI